MRRVYYSTAASARTYILPRKHAVQLVRSLRSGVCVSAALPNSNEAAQGQVTSGVRYVTDETATRRCTDGRRPLITTLYLK